MTKAEKRQKRGQLITEMRALTDTADKEKRSLTAEESTKWDGLDAEQERLNKELVDEDKGDERRAKLAALEGGLRQSTSSGARPNPGDGGSGNGAGDAAGELRSQMEKIGLDKRYQRALLNRPAVLSSPSYRSCFDTYADGGLTALQLLPTEERAALDQVRSIVPSEQRSLQADLSKKGGSLVAPTIWIAELLKALDDQVFVRQYATKYPVEMAEAMGVPTLETDLADADWTAELKTGSEGDLDLGTRELRPHPLAKRVKISNKLLRISSVPASALVQDRLQYKFAIAEEKGFLTGDGVQKPLGVFTPSVNGIPTSRDVPTGSATDVTADGLIDAKHSIKGAYWPILRWSLSREAIKRIRKLKDSTNQYLWQPGLTAGIPERILELPYDISEYVPNTFTTGLYVGALCAWRFYWIADALGLTVQVVDQLYAETNQTGFIGRKETDGAPVLAEAFARLKTN